MRLVSSPLRTKSGLEHMPRCAEAKGMIAEILVSCLQELSVQSENHTVHPGIAFARVLEALKRGYYNTTCLTYIATLDWSKNC